MGKHRVMRTLTMSPLVLASLPFPSSISKYLSPLPALTQPNGTSYPPQTESPICLCYFRCTHITIVHVQHVFLELLLPCAIHALVQLVLLVLLALTALHLLLALLVLHILQALVLLVLLVLFVICALVPPVCANTCTFTICSIGIVLSALLVQTVVPQKMQWLVKVGMTAEQKVQMESGFFRWIPRLLSFPANRSAPMSDLIVRATSDHGWRVRFPNSAP